MTQRDNPRMSSVEWRTVEHASRYLERADKFPRRLGGEGVT